MAKPKNIKDQDAIQARLRELKLEKLKIMQEKKSYQDKNLIEYFNSGIKLINGSELRANPKQQMILDAWQNPRFKVFTYTGANRTGKTTIGAIIAISCLRRMWPWSKEPIYFPHTDPIKIRYVGQAWESHIGQVVIPELYKWWPSWMKIKGGHPKKNSQGYEHLWVDEQTGGEISIMSSRQESDMFEGWKGDIIVWDEPPPRDVRVAAARGLADRDGRELFCMTLLKEPWVDREVINKRDDNGKPSKSIYNVHATIYDNLGYGITIGGIKELESKLSDEEKDIRLYGIPSHKKGLIYPQYTREKHIVERFSVPLDWMVDIAIDIHPRKQQAVLFTATAPNGYKYVVNEIWDYGDGTAIAEQIIRMVNWNVYRVNRCVIDPLSKGNSNEENTTFDRISEVLSRHNIYLEVASKDKNSGILSVKKHLEGPNKQPSLFIFDDCVRTIYEIEGWMWDKETQSPSKEDDDMMENLYRTILLDTKWSEMIEYNDEPVRSDVVNPITGY